MFTLEKLNSCLLTRGPHYLRSYRYLRNILLNTLERVADDFFNYITILTIKMMAELYNFLYKIQKLR